VAEAQKEWTERLGAQLFFSVKRSSLNDAPSSNSRQLLETYRCSKRHGYYGFHKWMLWLSYGIRNWQPA